MESPLAICLPFRADIRVGHAGDVRAVKGSVGHGVTHWEIGRSGDAGDIGLSQRIHREAVSDFIARATEVGAVEEILAGAVEFCDEGIASERTAMVVGGKAASGGEWNVVRHFGGEGLPSNVDGIIGEIHGHGPSDFASAAAKVGGKCRVNDQRL